jgi:hypothetical protein
MGPDSSRGELPSPGASSTIHSPHSYFGSSGQIGQKDAAELEATIRDLHRDRLSKYAAQTVPPPGGVKLKAFVAIGSPDPLLKLVRGCFCICLGLKADVPGRIVIAAGNLISSTTFHACDRRLISLPLPQPDRFVLEIVADIHEFKGRIERGFVPVSKHVLEFECPGPSRFVYATQKLYTGDRKYSMQINKQCQIEEIGDDDLCLVCLTEKAEVAVRECGHAAICHQCARHAEVRLHHCPFCDAGQQP